MNQPANAPVNQLGVHALVWAGDWTPASARFAIESSREVGFDLIEIPVLDRDPIDVDLTRQLLQDNGLGAVCSLGLAPDSDVSSEDEAAVARGRDQLARAVDVAAGLGAQRLGGVLYSYLGKYPGPISERSREHVVESMRWLARYGADRGVPISLEVVNRYETNVVNTAAEMLALIDEIASDGSVDPQSLTVHLDTYHMNIEENGFAEPVRRAAGRLGYVHVGESHRGYLGSGTIDFEQFFDALRGVGYTGAITFESFSSAVVHPSLSRQLAVWRNLWDDGRDLAAHAHAFLSKHLR